MNHWKSRHWRVLAPILLILAALGSWAILRPASRIKTLVRAGVSFRYDEAERSLTVELEQGTDADTRILVPTNRSCFYFESGGRRWTIDGQEVDLSHRDKRGLWGFRDGAVLRPGLALRFDVVTRAGANLTVDVGNGYQREVERRLEADVWTGNGQLR